MTEPTGAPEPIDPKRFRAVMSQVPTCVTIVTAIVDDEPQAMVIGSFVSVSLDPPLAGFFCTTTSATWQLLREAGSLGVNVLTEDQIELSNGFMRPPADRFDGVDWLLDHGAPRIANTAAWIRLTPHQVIDAGDHEFALYHVADMDLPETSSEPLVFAGGGYRTLKPKD